MATTEQPQVDFVKAISRLDATALVVGSMIGSGIFIVSAEILREVHAPGLLLVVWAASGVVTLMGALSYGELAAMFPKAGGQYVYLREGISPLFGYLYGWTLFVVIQTGTIAAVAVAFARFTAVFWPGLSPDVFLGSTVHFPQPIGDVAVGLSPQRLVAVLSVALLTWINVRGVRTAALIETRSEEHTSELQSQSNLVCRLLLEKKKPRPHPSSATRLVRCRRLHCPHSYTVHP